MIDTPQIVQLPARTTAFIPLTLTCEEMPLLMGPTLRELFDAISAQGILPSGPWFTHHLRRPTDTFQLEVSVPLSHPITSAGRIQPGEWPAMKAVQTVYQGPYEGLADAWPEFIAWIEDHGHRTADDFWECYTVGPHSNPDPATWRTEFTRQLLD